MKPTLIVILSLIILCSCSYTPDPWTKEDTIRHTAYTALHVIDWRQTREIAKKPGQYYEINPILGRHPSKDAVDTYFITSYFVVSGVVYVLPAKWRKWAHYVGIGIEAACVGNNFSIGLNGDW